MPILMKPVSAMEKCFMDEAYESKKAISAGTALRGEEFCFEIAYTSDEPGHHPKATFTLAVESPIAEYVTVSKVEQVPVRVPCYRWADDNYLRKEPGMFPDLLAPAKPGTLVFVTYGELKSLLDRTRAFLARNAALSKVPPTPTPTTMGGQGLGPASSTTCNTKSLTPCKPSEGFSILI